MRADRAPFFARGVHGGPGGWPLAGFRKFCILRGKYTQFFSLNVQEIGLKDCWWLQGGSPPLH